VNGIYAPQAISVSVMAPPRYRLQSLIVQNVVFLAILPFMAMYFQTEGVATARLVGAGVMAWMSCYFLRKLVRAPLDLRAVRAVLGPSIVLVLLAVPPQVLFYRQWIVPAYLAAAGLAYTWLFVRSVDEEDLHLLEHLLPDRLKWASRACWRLRPAAERAAGV